MSTTTTPEVQELTAAETETGREIRPKWLARGAAAIVIVSAIAAGTMFWLDSQHYETTDDAQVDGHFASLSSRIDGTVVWINPNAENDHAVKAGDLLLQLDPRDYETALERAKADLKIRVAQARGAAAEVPVVDASADNRLRAAEASRDEALAGVETA